MHQRSHVLQRERRQLHARLADGGAGRSGDRPPQVFRATNAVAGAGWNAFSTYRKKPQLKAQLTLLPARTRAAATTSSSGSRCSRTRIATATTGRPGRSATRMPAPTRASRRIAFGSSTPARRPSYGTDWTVGPTTDRALRRLRPGSLVAERQAHLHARRALRLPAGRLRRRDRGNRSSPTCLSDGTSDLPDRHRRDRGQILSNTNFAPRLGVTYDLTGKGRTVLKAFYGRYYNNIADSFTGDQPGRPVDCGVQLPRPEPQQPLRRAVGARHASACARAATATRGRSRLQDAVHRGDQRVVRDPAARRVVGPRHLRSEEPSTTAAPYYGTNLVPAWVGN